MREALDASVEGAADLAPMREALDASVEGAAASAPMREALDASVEGAADLARKAARASTLPASGAPPEVA